MLKNNGIHKKLLPILLPKKVGSLDSRPLCITSPVLYPACIYQFPIPLHLHLNTAVNTENLKMAQCCTISSLPAELKHCGTVSRNFVTEHPLVHYGMLA